MPNPTIVTVDAWGEDVAAKIETRTPGRWALKDSHSVATITAPGYLRDRVVLPFSGELVVPMVMNPETAKGPELQEAASSAISSAIGHAFVGGMSAISHLVQPFEALAADLDRIYLKAEPGFERSLERTGAFESVPGGMHKPHDAAFEQVGSWKTTRGAPVLQVTLWKCQRLALVNTEGYNKPVASSWDYVAEMDIDLSSGAGHVLEVIRNHATGNKTHPYLAGQALVWCWGIDVGYRLEPGNTSNGRR